MRQAIYSLKDASKGRVSGSMAHWPIGHRPPSVDTDWTGLASCECQCERQCERPFPSLQFLPLASFSSNHILSSDLILAVILLASRRQTTSLAFFAAPL